MSFNPTIRIFQPDNEPDLLAGATLAALTRRFGRRCSWDVARSFAGTLLTLGLLPTILLPRWLRDVAAQERQQLWHLAEWLRLQTGLPAAIAMQEQIGRLGEHRGVARLTTAMALLAAAAAITHIVITGNVVGLVLPFRGGASAMVACHHIALAVAGLSHWALVVGRQSELHQCIRIFNVLAEREMLPAMRTRTELGLGPLWVIAAVMLGVAGMIWAVPVMLAAAAHTRYTRVASTAIRGELAERLRVMLARRRPRMRIAQPIIMLRTCIRPDCRAALPGDASFCPRCGTRVARTMNMIA